jgi:polyisoprenoid-binding protein YceI
MFAGTAIWFWAAVATWAAEPVPTVPGMTQSVPGLQAPLPPAATGAKQAQPAPEWSFDPAHCSMLFFVRHIFVKIPGRFAKFTGTVRFDPDNLEGSLIDVSVDMASVDTFVAKRDEDLRSPDFFDVARYPGMWFVSQRIVHKDGDQYAAEGDLTIKDVTRHIEIPFTYLGAKASPLAPDKQVAGFESHFSINMLDYHVSDGHFQKMGAMGDAVEIVLNQELTR